MKRDPEWKAGVQKQMNAIIGEGHARKVDNPEVPEGHPLFYLPMHIDTRKYPKFRVCQDEAAKIRGVCLNDELLAGPDLLNRLVGVLLRFRRHKVAVSADIKGFFHQIYVTEDDSSVFRFYWYEDEDMNNMVEFEMIVHTFGSKPSPCVATFVLRYHGEKISGEVTPDSQRCYMPSSCVSMLMIF